MPIVKLTPSFIANNLQCAEAKARIEYCDEMLPGLYVEVRSTSEGQGTFYLRYKDRNGKTCHQRIGRTIDVDFVDARKQAKILRAEIALGSDPRGEEKARQAVLSFTEFFVDHYLPYVKPRKRSWARDEELFRLRIQDVLGHKRLDQITRQQIQSFHTALIAEGLAPATCIYHIKLIKHSFNWQLIGICWTPTQPPVYPCSTKITRWNII